MKPHRRKKKNRKVPKSLAIDDINQPDVIHEDESLGNSTTASSKKAIQSLSLKHNMLIEQLKSSSVIFAKQKSNVQDVEDEKEEQPPKKYEQLLQSLSLKHAQLFEQLQWSSAELKALREENAALKQDKKILSKKLNTISVKYARLKKEKKAMDKKLDWLRRKVSLDRDDGGYADDDEKSIVSTQSEDGGMFSNFTEGMGKIMFGTLFPTNAQIYDDSDVKSVSTYWY